MNQKEPGFWRGFAWGAIGIPLIVGAAGLVATTIVTVAATIINRGKIIGGD